MTLVLLLHTAATLFMTGLIWFVQVVHYPLFAHVERDGFAVYADRHASRTARVVGPVMSAELITGAVLVIQPPAGQLAAAIAGLALLLVIWLSTAFIQVPQHERLRRGYTDADRKALVDLNWIRTAAWSARAILVLWLIAPSSS